MGEHTQFTEVDNLALQAAGEHAQERKITRELVAALEGLEVLFRRDGENTLDHFERVGEAFLKDTGYLRPGKDCRVHSHEKREEVWGTWIDDKLVDARVALIHARAEPKEQP